MGLLMGLPVEKSGPSVNAGPQRGRGTKIWSGYLLKSARLLLTKNPGWRNCGVFQQAGPLLEPARVANQPSLLKKRAFLALIAVC